MENRENTQREKDTQRIIGLTAKKMEGRENSEENNKKKKEILNKIRAELVGHDSETVRYIKNMLEKP